MWEIQASKRLLEAWFGVGETNSVVISRKLYLWETSSEVIFLKLISGQSCWETNSLMLSMGERWLSMLCTGRNIVIILCWTFWKLAGDRGPKIPERFPRSWDLLLQGQFLKFWKLTLKSWNSWSRHSQVRSSPYGRIASCKCLRKIYEFMSICVCMGGRSNPKVVREDRFIIYLCRIPSW